MHCQQMNIRMGLERIFLGSGRPCTVDFQGCEGQGRIDMKFQGAPGIQIKEDKTRLSIQINGQPLQNDQTENAITIWIGDELPPCLAMSLVCSKIHIDRTVAEQLTIKAVESSVRIDEGAFAKAADISLVAGQLAMEVIGRLGLRLKAIQADGVLDLSRYSGEIRRLKLISRGNILTCRSMEHGGQSDLRPQADLHIIGDDMELIRPSEYIADPSSV